MGTVADTAVFGAGRAGGVAGRAYTIGVAPSDTLTVPTWVNPGEDEAANRRARVDQYFTIRKDTPR